MEAKFRLVVHGANQQQTCARLPVRPALLRVFITPPPVFLPSGAMRSVLQALTVRTVKVCVTVRTVHAATTSTEAACASRASAGHTAGTGCVRPVNTACTVSAPVSARTNTHSGK